MNSKHMDKLEAAIKGSIKDAKADFPDVNEDDIVHEMVVANTIGHSLSVKNEMLRRFGYA